jgi:AcrR family transcriptional regulator
VKTNSLSERPVTLRDRHKSATRDAILDAAATLLTDASSHVRMDDIAGKAGIGVGTLYNYFSDRTALVEALLEVRRAALLDSLDAVDRTTPVRDRLLRFVEILAGHFEGSRPLLVILFEQERTPGSVQASRRQTLRSELLRRAEALIADGVKQRVLRDGDPAAYATLLVGMVRGVSDMLLARGTGRFADYAQLIVDMFLRGAAR